MDEVRKHKGINNKTTIESDEISELGSSATKIIKQDNRLETQR
jgi:hypothetical protein